MGMDHQARTVSQGNGPLVDEYIITNDFVVRAKGLSNVWKL
jgi:hypothetical protein